MEEPEKIQVPAATDESLGEEPEIQAQESLDDSASDEPSDPQAVQAVREIFTAFTKTIKTFNTYPPDNPIYQKFALELSKRFDTFFENHDDLVLCIRQNSLEYDSVEIYQSDERAGNLAMMLYLDGIRELTFLSGLTPGEIVDFIDILRAAPSGENLEDDIVTLLWERDLEHITYHVPEEWFADDMDVIDEVTDAGAEASESMTLLGATYSDLSFKPLELDINPGVLDDNALKSIRDEAMKMDAQTFRADVSEILVEVISIETDPEEFAFLSDMAGEIAMREIAAGNVLEALAMVRTLFTSKCAVDEGLKSAALRKALAGVGSPSNIRQVLKQANDPSMLKGFLSVLGADSIPGLIEVLGELENKDLRRLFCSIIARLAPHDIEAFKTWADDERWFLVRNIVMILGLSKTPDAVPIIERVIRHPEARVRRETVRALEAIHSETSRKPLRILLGDQDAAIRVLSLRALGRYENERILPLIRETVQGEEFAHRTFEEKREFLEALGRSGTEDALNILKSLFMKKGLFHREENLELKACAAYGLGRHSSPAALELLRTEAGSKKSMLRDACLWGIGLHEGAQRKADSTKTDPESQDEAAEESPEGSEK